MNYQFNNLKLFRKQNGYTQEDVAERIGVSRQTVAKWERGEAQPDLDSCIALADLYETTVDSLVRDFEKNASDDQLDGKHLFGVTVINSKGQVTLPKKAREVFDLNPGSAILVLGDEKRGIALVKMGIIPNNKKSD